MRSHESGNAIFYILIAVALLAGLSYAVSLSGRGNQSAISSQQARLHALGIIEYAEILKNSVSQIRLRGYQDTEISFENNIVSGYENAFCTGEGCKLFEINGGGISYLEPEALWLDSAAASATPFTEIGDLLGEWYIPANTCVHSVGTGGDNCWNDPGDVTELIVFLPWVKEQICEEINIALGINLPDGTPSDIGGSMFPPGGDKFEGVYLTGSIHPHVDNDFVEEACIYHKSVEARPGLGYFYYKVLIAR